MNTNRIVVPVLHSYIVLIGQIALIQSANNKNALIISHTHIEPCKCEHRKQRAEPNSAHASDQSEEAVEKKVKIRDDMIGHRLAYAITIILKKNKPRQKLHNHQLQYDHDNERQQELRQRIEQLRKIEEQLADKSAHEYAHVEDHIAVDKMSNQIARVVDRVRGDLITEPVASLDYFGIFFHVIIGNE